MKMRTCLLLLFAVTLYSGCTPEKSVDDLDWMLGKWEGKRDEMDIHEIWVRDGDDRMSGQGVALIDGDTVFHERTSIESKDGILYFTATVPGNPGPVSFKLTVLDRHMAVFENPDHDFPKTITYNLLSEGSLSAWVEGFEGGKKVTEEFHYLRSE